MNRLEIQNRLQQIKERGYIASRRRGSTGIGHTLEQELHLTENNLAIPDLGGRVELKATRRHSSSMVTLLTFNRSVWAMKQQQIIETYGYKDSNQRPALYSTVQHARSNSQNLELKLDRDNHKVHLYHTSGVLLATWSIYTIMAKFLTKLERLLIVLADSRKSASGGEEFLFNEAYLLENPSAESFLTAFADAQIAIDIRMHLKETGAVRNHGTGFRIRESNIVNLYAQRRKIL